MQKILTATLFGLECKIVEVEIDRQYGLNSLMLVGLGDRAIQESKQRVVAAIRNSGFEFTPERITINLAPSHIYKHGTHFDLAIAMSYLCATGQTKVEPNTLFLGELSLDGKLRTSKGILPLVHGAKLLGIKHVVVPRDAYAEAALVNGIKVIAVKDLAECVKVMKNLDDYSAPRVNQREPDETDREVPFAGIIGQLHAKRALAIAAAGLHNILLVGPPGCGKTLLANDIIKLLPDLKHDSALEVASVHSVAGLLTNQSEFSNRPPFRAPHHSTSIPALLGGGSVPRPGEVSLAHKGVLFLDELPEFSPAVLDSLRQSLESPHVTVSRANYNVKFPADFMLVAAMNPCKCGNTGSGKPCTCSTRSSQQYRQKLSGPLLDRFDMVIQLRPVRDTGVKDETDYIDLVNNAVTAERLNVKQLISMSEFDAFIQKLLRGGLTMRGVKKLLEVAQTIALTQKSAVKVEHLAEAVQYRNIGFT